MSVITGGRGVRSMRVVCGPYDKSTTLPEECLAQDHSRDVILS
jgi:hypothetical protein